MNRQEFEQFAMSEACPLARDGDGYANARTNTFWAVWNAALASRPEMQPVATVIKSGAERSWMSENLGAVPDGKHSLYLARSSVGDSFFQEALGELASTRDLLDAMAKDTTSSAAGMQNKAVTAYMRARDAVVRLKERVHG